MRLSRLAPALAAGALFASSVSPAHAQAPTAEEGVGTSRGSLTLLGLDAGGLLSVDLLSDAALANVDEAVGARSAAAQLAALTVESPAAGVSQTLPLLSVESTDGPEEASQAVTPIENPVVSGSLLPVSLHALVDDAGAASEVRAGLADLDVLGGILQLAGSTIELGGQALQEGSAATRGVDLDAVTVLDLEALLAGLGIPLSDLSLDSLLGLIDGLGLLPQLDAALAPLGIDLGDLGPDAVVTLLDTTLDGLLGEVDAVLAGVETVEDLLLDLTSTVTGPVCELTDPVVDLVGDVLGGVLGGLPLAPGGSGTSVCSDLLGDVTTSVDALTDQLAELTDEVEALLDQVLALVEAPLDVLAGAPLLSLDGLDVTVVTEATDEVATSVAEVTGTLGELRVGELSLGALELSETTGVLDGLLAQVEGTLGGILGEISPALRDLISVRTMEETTSVAQDGDAVVASAAFTGLQVDVLPDVAELLGVLDGLGGPDSLGAVLDGLGLPVPASGATEVLDLGSLLGGVPTGGLELDDQVLALTEGLTVQVASITQESRFAPADAAGPPTQGPTGSPTAPAPRPTLPRTGGDDGLVLALAAAAVVAALGGRALLRRVPSRG